MSDTPAVLSAALAVTALAANLLTGCHTLPAPTSGRVVVQNQNARVEVGFNDDDRHYIHNYYKHHHKSKHHQKGMPPGLAKKKHLTPGHQKQLMRKGTLPPGLEKRRLPADLERQLRPLPSGYVRVQVGRDIVLFDERTRVILDIIYDIGG